jgi:hypothetical protein
MVEGVRDQSSILVGGEREWVGPYCSSVVKPCPEAGKDGFGHVGANFVGGKCVSEGDDGRGAVSNSQRSGALEDVLKVFVMEQGGATRAAPIKGSFATARVMMAEGREKAKLEFVGSLVVATEATSKGSFQVEPRDVVENRVGEEVDVVGEGDMTDDGLFVGGESGKELCKGGGDRRGKTGGRRVITVAVRKALEGEKGLDVDQSDRESIRWRCGDKVEMLSMDTMVVDGGGGQVVPVVVTKGEHSAIVVHRVPALALLGGMSPCAKRVG